MILLQEALDGEAVKPGLAMTTTRQTFLVAALSAVSVDLGTKLLAVSTLSAKTIDLGLVELRLVHNEGVSFGLGRRCRGGYWFC